MQHRGSLPFDTDDVGSIGPVHGDGNVSGLPLRRLSGGQSRKTKTWMTVKVELFAEHLLSGKRQLCTRGRFVLVALDQRGRPTAVPELPSSSIQIQGS